MIADALRTRILGDATVSAQVGTRMYPLDASPEVDTPYIVYGRMFSDRIGNLDGHSGITMARFEIVVWDTSYTTARTIMEALMTRVDGFTGTVGTDAIRGIFIVDRHDDFVPAEKEHETGLYANLADVEVWYDSS
jgi:hypothetical protein